MGSPGLLVGVSDSFVQFDNLGFGSELWNFLYLGEKLVLMLYLPFYL